MILGNLAQTSPRPAAETWPPASGDVRVGLVPLGVVPCYVSLRPFLSLDWLSFYSRGWALPALFGLSGPVVLSDTAHRGRCAWGTGLVWQRGEESPCEKQRAWVTESDGERECVEQKQM